MRSCFFSSQLNAPADEMVRWGLVRAGGLCITDLFPRRALVLATLCGRACGRGVGLGPGSGIRLERPASRGMVVSGLWAARSKLLVAVRRSRASKRMHGATVPDVCSTRSCSCVIRFTQTLPPAGSPCLRLTTMHRRVSVCVCVRVKLSEA